MKKRRLPIGRGEHELAKPPELECKGDELENNQEKKVRRRIDA